MRTFLVIGLESTTLILPFKSNGRFLRIDKQPWSAGHSQKSLALEESRYDHSRNFYYIGK